MESIPKVLVVSNDEQLVTLTQRAMEGQCDIVAASTAKKGIEMIDSEMPNLVILGYLEPRGTSFLFHKELQDQTAAWDPSLMVVDVRSEEHHQKGWSQEEGLQMEADDYLMLPLTPSELRGAVIRALEKSRGESAGLKVVAGQIAEVLA